MAGDTCKHVLDKDRTQPIFAVVPIDLPSGNHTVMIERPVSTVTPPQAGYNGLNFARSRSRRNSYSNEEALDLGRRARMALGL